MLETLASIAAAGLFSFAGAFMAVRTQMARLEAKQEATDNRVNEHSERITRLEAPFFAAFPNHPLSISNPR